MPEYCVFCGKLIPEREYPPVTFIVRKYCSTSCAQRQQTAIKRLRDTTPPETAEPHDSVLTA